MSLEVCQTLLFTLSTFCICFVYFLYLSCLLSVFVFSTFCICLSAKSSRKLTFLYLANDVIQNSKKKGPEFAKDFETVLVDACSHVARYVVWDDTVSELNFSLALKCSFKRLVLQAYVLVYRVCIGGLA